MGVAGTGDDVAVFWCDSPATEDALDALAALKLAEINQDDSSVVLTCPVGEGVHLFPGDTIPVVKPQLNLDDDYRIMKTVKRRFDMEIEIIRSKKSTEKILEELSKGTTSSFSLTTFLSQFGGEAAAFSSSLFRLPLSLICGIEIIFSPYLRKFPLMALLLKTEVAEPFVASISTVLTTGIQT